MQKLAQDLDQAHFKQLVGEAVNIALVKAGIIERPTPPSGPDNQRKPGLKIVK